jgi:hypothetical protein
MPWKVTTIFYEYEKSAKPLVSDLLQDPRILEKLGKEVDMICSSTFSFDEIKVSDLVSQVKKKTKFKKFYLRSLTDDEIQNK